MITCSSELPSAAIMVDVLKGRRAEELKKLETLEPIHVFPNTLQDILLWPCTGTYMRLLSVHAMHFADVITVAASHLPCQIL
jgi:hypothetical protein